MSIFPIFLWIATLLLPTFCFADNYTNPLKKKDGSDPFIVYTEGYYYLTTTTWKDVQLTRARNLEGLKNGQTKVIHRDNAANRCCSVWAPEIHEIDGVWHVYYTAGTAQNFDGQRPHVLRGGASPWDAYTYAGSVSGVQGWGIDGTVSVINDKRYFIWSCINPKGQSLCIGELASPTKIKSQHLLSWPNTAFERYGDFPVNEGPAVMQHRGKVFMTYSASHCASPNYSLGLLTLKEGEDPISQSSWTKKGPVLSSANDNYGTGHNGLFQGSDGSWWNVYHATANKRGNCVGDRYTMVDRVSFDSNGNPRFGVPAERGTVLEGPGDGPGDGPVAG